MNAVEKKKQAQSLHDMAASCGAQCPRSSTSSGAPDDHSRFLQAVHDMALGSGASCALYREGNQAPIETYHLGQHYSAGGDGPRPAYGNYLPGRYASMAGFADDESLSPELAEVKAGAEAYAARRNATSGGVPPSGV